MQMGLFDSVKGNMIHYFIRPDDDFVLNSLEKLDANSFLYRVLREEGYQQIFFVDIRETHYSVLTYDRFSYWATVKPKDFEKVDMGDARTVSTFLGETPNLTRKPAGKGLNTRFLKPSAQVPATNPQPEEPANQKNVPVFGKCQLQTFASAEEFSAFFLNRISPAINSGKVKTAVVIPMELFEQTGRISQTVIDKVVIQTIRAAQKNNQSKNNVILLTTTRRANLSNCMDIPNFRDLHYWVPGVLQNATYQTDRVELAVETLRQEGILLLADSICDDEIANLLLRKKLVEQDPRYAQLKVSKIYQMAELLAEHCRMERSHFDSFRPFRMYDYIRQLDSLLSQDPVARELVRKSQTLKGRMVKDMPQTNAVALERITHQRADRSQRSQEEIQEDYQQAMQPLNSLIGLGNVKSSLELHMNNVLVYGGKNGPGHYIFAGNPGTGKTEVARLMGNVFKALGLLSKGHLVECKKADLVAEHIGGSAQKTKKKCLEALDGVLFVDEAYELVNLEPTGRKFKSSFDEEAYTEIMTFMENNRKRVCVIFAGYREPMEVFRNANPGMPRRLPKSNIVDFDDYSAEELYDIFALFAQKDIDGSFALSEEFSVLLRKVLNKLVKSKSENFGNAGQMRELFTQCKKLAAQRVVRTGDSSRKFLLLPEDIPAEYDLHASEEEFAQAMQRLNELIGLASVKSAVQTLLDTQLAYGADQGPGHYVFAGNPGTGKTEVARLMGQILKAQGFLSKGHLVECKKADLVAGFTGQSAIKTRAVCESALDGVLFVDEAYDLVNTEPTGEKFQSSFDEEVYTEIMTFMENNRHRVCVIFAGYTKEMQIFVKANPGMERRITETIHFPDYNAEELLAIFQLFAKKDGFQLSEEFESLIRKTIEKLAKHPGENFGNAGAMRKLFQACKKQAAKRYGKTRDEERKYLLLPEDIPAEYDLHPSEEELAQAMQRLNELIGLASVKTAVQTLLDTQLAYGADQGPGHYVFAGNPGTGKTEVARLMGQILKAQGFLSKGHLVECKKADLVAGFTGQSAEKTRTVCESALDGVLFVDEAYDLVNTEHTGEKFKSSFDEEVYTEIMTFMENNRHRVCVIFAGYTKEMQIFVKANPGMERRITETIHFPDYNAEELLAIFRLFAKKDGFRLSEEFAEAIEMTIRALAKHPEPNFGNAGAMRKLFQECKKQAAKRYVRERKEEDKYRLLPGDIPEVHRSAFDEEALAQAMVELNALIGLQSVKSAIDELVAQKRIYGGSEAPGHFVFTGNPGTGKTEVARKMGQIFKAMGLLTRGHVVECNKADLVGSFMGETVNKTRSVCESALDGILFVDEAYTLAKGVRSRNGGASYEEEAYTEIMTFMENNRHRVCVIFAGYENEMNNFMDANDGMRSRISNIIHFPDYSDEELLKILKLMASKAEYTFAPGFDEAAMEAIAEKKRETYGKFANAREMRNLLAQVRRNISLRINQLYLAGKTEEAEAAKRMLTPEDIRPADKQGQSRKDASAMDELNALIGLDSVKNQIRRLKNRIQYSGDSRKVVEPGHYVFAGNPGTGKTEVARLMGRIFKSVGVLPKGHVVEVARNDLVGMWSGQTSELTAAKCKEALGGVLFVDEAYTLFGRYKSDLGQEALDTIMKFMEDNRSQICVIFAGYENRMMELMDANEGFYSRIKEVIHFPDYSGEELTQILQLMMRKADLEYTEGFLQEARGLLEHLAVSRKKNFGNAREVRKLLNSADERRADRIGSMIDKGVDISTIQINLLTEEDLDLSYKAQQAGASEEDQNAPSYHTIPAQIIETLEPCCKETACRDRIQLGKATDPAVLFVHTDTGEGTAFLIAPDGYALTCDHVIHGAKKIQARFRMPGRAGQEDSWHTCQVVNTREDLDIALLKLDGCNFPYLSLAAADRQIQKGEEFLLSGYPFGRRTAKDLTTFYGYVASSEKQTDEHGFVRYNINSEAKSGNSGAPVIALSDGRVIGILLGSMTGKSGQLLEEINYMRPITYFWDSFLTYESTDSKKASIDRRMYSSFGNEALLEALEEFEALSGLETTKTAILDEINNCLFCNPQSAGLYVLTDDSGTSKAEVACKLGKILKAMGLLKKGHVVEVSRNDLLVSCDGESTQKTCTYFERALDGILYVDKFDELLNTETNQGLFKSLDDDKVFCEIMSFYFGEHWGRNCVVLSGATSKIREFLACYPGFSRKVNLVVHEPPEHET